MNPATTNLIAALIPAVTQLGIEAVHGIADLVHGSPKQQGETDAAYIARIGTQIDDKLADAEAKDKQVES